MMYKTLAYYYDELLGDNDSLKLWINQLEKNIKGKKVLELACGSGELAIMLAKKGYDVFATDLSSSMIEVAEKKVHLPNLKFDVMDMTNFQINEKYDAIICFCDSFNYLNNYNEVSLMIKNVYNHLNENGVFIFDTHHSERLNEFENEYIEEGYVNDLAYSWTILSDKINNTLMEHFAFYTTEGLIEEDHLQHVFDIVELKKLMLEGNYQVEVINEFIEAEKALVIGRKI